MRSFQADVVVVGAGLAGLTAANRAAEAGCRVLVLEKGGDQRYPCNSRIATGVLLMAHADPMSDPSVLRQAIDDDTEGYADPVLADALARAAGPSLQWLRAAGVRLLKVPVQGSQVWMLAPPRLPSVGHHWQGHGPDLMLQALAGRLQAMGSHIARATRARRLCTEDGRCTGVEAEQAGASVRFEARQVVLADGGFQGNPDLVRRFISPRPEYLVQRSAGTGIGDALIMAEEAGAKLTQAESFYGHLLCQDALSNAQLWPYPTMDTLVGGAIMVDRSGRRFIDEGLGGVTLSNALARLDDPLAATAIFDHAIWETSGRVERVAPNPHLPRAGGTLISRPDLESLAEALGLPQATLKQTVVDYNEAVADGRGQALRPARTAGRVFAASRASAERTRLLPLGTPPYYGVRLCAGISFTMGGIAIGPDGCVLSRRAGPIPGLLAAGSCTGGVDGGPVSGYIGGLMRALCLGWIAGNTAARACTASQPGGTR